MSSSQSDAGPPDGDATVGDAGGVDPSDRPVIADDIDRTTIAPVDSTAVVADDYSSDDQMVDFVLQYAVRFCNKLFTCQSRATTRYAAGAGINSPATCMEFYQTHYSPQRLVAGRDNDRLAFDAAAASSCLQTIEQLPCEQFGAQIEALDDEYRRCPDVFVGQSGADQTCLGHAECPDGYRCLAALDGASCEGTCQRDQSACGDAQCDLATEYCDQNLTCQPLGTTGESCTSRFDCTPLHYCDARADEPTCQPYSTGVPADSRCELATDVCESGTFCRPYYQGGPLACRRPKSEGGTCLNGFPRSGCVASTYCKPSTGDGQASCASRKTADETCQTGRECVSGRCANGVCIAPETPCVTPQ